jgi:hypothetical protein
LKIKAFTTLPLKKADLNTLINQALSIATAMIAGRLKDAYFFCAAPRVLCISQSSKNMFEGVFVVTVGKN